MSDRTTVLVTVAVGALGVAAAACGDNTGTEPAGLAPDCNPLGGQGCLLPWPSMAYLRADASTPSGYRLDLPVAGMPVNTDGVAIDPAPLDARWDGFSPTGPILAMFPRGVSPDGLPSFRTPDDSLAPGSPIVLYDLDRGERAPLFAEVDQNVVDVDHRALVIRPLARLHERTHYAVAIRNTAHSADGTPLPVSPGFAALRDGLPLDHPRFAALAAGAPAMFDGLAAAGVDRSELVLAWDFRTASDELLRGDLTAMRTAALPAIGDRGAGLGERPFTVEDQPNTAQSYRRFTGTYKSPDFLTAGETASSILARDAAGAPRMHGLRDAKFAAIIGNPVKDILMWYSIGDCLVSNITTELTARTMGIGMIGPSVKAPWGLAPAPGAFPSGIVVFDDHPTPLPPDTNEPPARDNGTHSGINRKPAALRMVQRFLLPPDRQAVDGCALAGSPAPCDCATGACD